jgi:hypothetical protein
MVFPETFSIHGTGEDSKKGAETSSALGWGGGSSPLPSLKSSPIGLVLALPNVLPGTTPLPGYITPARISPRIIESPTDAISIAC